MKNSLRKVNNLDMFNSITPAMWTHKHKGKKTKGGIQELADDLDGTATLSFLNRVIDVARLVAGPPECNGSLGLEQAVYAYGSTGSIHPAAYLASLRFFYELRQQNKLVLFSVFRNTFEEFLVRHKPFINALGHTKGSRTRPLEAILQMYRIVFEAVQNDHPDKQIVKKLQEDQQLRTAILTVPALGDDGKAPQKKFSKAVVKAKVVQDVLDTRPRCPVCGARLPPAYRSKDHITKVEHGGMGNIENLNFTHSYCNHSRDAIEAAQAKAHKQKVGNK